ncbi:hypothetical protein PI95_029560 [Hassallia byssoidea VB512170]|uniref:Uncharacterized protein n=1 Tax=Hassallia byssoidea VB512170 TaxID=1304833 RepID=A0A846HHY5_9CYAN|nr:hypothetical protein [Hassalia byssoidea]NEU76548.1 hypothetical protein [Hassalia byssoidea VB512170]
MPFQKNNQLGARKRLKRPLDKEVIAFRGYEGQKEKLKTVPDWQERLREFVDQLISELPKND